MIPKIRAFIARFDPNIAVLISAAYLGCMSLTRLLLILPAILVSPHAAQACWDTPNQACFADLWQDEAMAYHADGPKAERLFDLIDWEVIPPGETSARTLMQDIHYKDLVAHHAATNADDQPGLSETEQALRLLMGLPEELPAPEVNSDYLFEIYLLSLATNDRNLSGEWYLRLPEFMRSNPEVPSPDGTPKYPDPYLTAQADALTALTHLRAGAVDKAVTAAQGIQGEPGFLTWRALARHAIAKDDAALLARAVTGLDTTFTQQENQPFDEEAFERAIEVAEAEFALTGDADALVSALESSDPLAYALPVGAGITVALAHRYLNHLENKAGEDGFETALDAMQQALQNRDEEDDATPMLNARTALRLGLEDETNRLITMTDTHFPGVPGFYLYDLPPEPEPWAEAWLDRMITRFDHIVANSHTYDTREYWNIWLEQDALEAAIDIAQTLALYDRRHEAHDFADRALAYLETLPRRYPDAVRSNLAALFDGETAAFLYPPDVAIPRMRRLGMDETLIQYAFANARRPVIALKLLAGQEGYRSLSHWMKRAPEVPDYLRASYTDILRPLIEQEPARLFEQGYPNLAQALHVEAAVYWANQGDWAAAQRHYNLIEDATGKHGPAPAVRNRLVVLRDIARHLSTTPAPVAYPHEDFAL